MNISAFNQMIASRRSIYPRDYKNEKIVANKTIGNVVCYDSDIPHEVTEVTEGTRISGLIVLNVKDFELSLL